MVMLAAGQAKRFGGGKLTAEFHGRPLWERAAETAEAIDFSERVLVIEPNSPIGSRLGWVQVENQFAKQGMGTSIAAGVRALTDCDRVIIMLADMPLVSRSHLDRRIAAQGVGFTRYPDGSAGCPAIFPRLVFPLLESLDGDRGARSLDLGGAELIAPSQKRQLTDIDEFGDLQRLRFAG